MMHSNSHVRKLVPQQSSAKEHAAKEAASRIVRELKALTGKETPNLEVRRPGSVKATVDAIRTEFASR